MGRMLIDAVLAAPDCTGGRAGHPAARRWARTRRRLRLGRTPAVASPPTCAGLAGAEVLIDFTRPEGTLAHLAPAAARRAAVIGTTGFSRRRRPDRRRTRGTSRS
jgi:4-hydroxy-tetrahydrodipicolinate reductase